MKKQMQYNQYVLPPGFLSISRNPALMCSVCGSGVVVTVWHKIKKVGAMAHCLYPKVMRGEKPTNYHASVAIPNLLSHFKTFSFTPTVYEVQLFGGGGFSKKTVKEQKLLIKEIKRGLKHQNLFVASEDILGEVGRKVMFNTYSGEIVVLKTKRIRKTDWALSVPR